MQNFCTSMFYGMSTKKKVQKSGKLHMTLHTHRLCSLQYSRMPYMCVLSDSVHATEALLLVRLQKSMPTETVVTCHMLQSVWQEKTMKFSSINILLLLFSLSFTYRLPFLYQGVTVPRSMP